MALLGDRVQESTTTTGTGSFTLNGAVTGYTTFNSTFTNGDIVWYVADDGAGNWEIGTGTVGTGTLTRSVFQSSNSNNLVNFAVGTKRIFCTAPYTYLLPDQTGNTGKILSTDGSIPSWITAPTGTVTSVSVASANGFAGTSSGGATPALTLSTTVTGLLKGNGTAISAASAGTDYAAANATFTLGSTSVALGGTTTTVAGLTLTNPTINGFTGNTSVVNIGSGQFYKDTSGNVGIGTTSPGNKLTLSDAGALSIQISSALSGGSNLLLTANGTGGEVNMVNGLPLLFKTSNTERMRLDSSGNLGLGVTPSSWGSAFKVSQYLGGFAGSQSSLYAYSGQNAYYDGTSWKRVAAGYASLLEQSGGQFLFYNAGTSTAGSTISFTQAMTLDASGNLGIGTTSPNAPLSFSNSISGTAGLNNKIQLYNSGGAGIFGFGLYTGQLTYNCGDGAHVFYTNGGTPVERARINSSGQFLVNTASSTAAGIQAGAIQASGEFFSQGGYAGFFWANRSTTPTSTTNWYGWYTTSGTIYLFNGSANISSINASTGVYTALSDRNKKKDFEDSDIGLDAVLKLKPTLFRMKDADANSTKELGFIAQDVKDVIPQAYVEQIVEDASGNESTYIGLNDRPVIAALTKAIQELSAELNELKGKIA